MQRQASGHGTATAHAGHLAGSHVSCNKVLSPNFGSRLCCKGWGELPGEVGQKSLSSNALKLALTNALSKKLCCKSSIWKESDSFHGSQRFFFIMDNINAWLIPKITAVGIFALPLGMFLIDR